MPLTNNVMIVRHKLLTNLIKLWKDNQLVERIDRLPIELSPRTSRVLGRCCVHKERAVWKYKSFPLMGFDMSDETDELTPLSEYARKALERKGQQQKDNILCVIDEACSSCVQTNYEITNLCKGCVARACATNCPKNAIEFNRAGKAVINHDLCISCGICHSNCPYHAIVYMPVPCEEACPVKAITKDERGVEHIDESKCIYCGKCINSCPFGAIFEISQVFDVLQRLREGEKMVAVVAPAILGQYNAPTEKVYGAIKAIGFEDVIEVAQGAMETIRNEGAELEEKIEEGQAFMTTSCCPSWVELANKHIPEMKPFISSTGSPMYYAARIAKEKHPDAQVVFIGVAACQMEKKGIATEKGELNRNIQKANRLIREIRAQIGKLKEWIGELFKARETAPEQPPQSPGLANLLMKYLSVQREKSRKYSQSWQRQHAADELKTVAKAVNYLSEHGISTLDELDAALSSVSDQADAIREGMKTAEKRMKELQKLIEYGKNYTEYKPIHDELKKLKNGWTSKRDKYEEAHRAELTLWNAASRYLHANLPKGTKTLPISEWEKEYATLSGQRTAEYTKLKETRAEVAELHNIRKCVDIALKADQPEQTRAKRHEQER